MRRIDFEDVVSQLENMGFQARYRAGYRGRHRTRSGPAVETSAPAAMVGWVVASLGLSHQDVPRHQDKAGSVAVYY